jgi:flagellin-like protein
LGDGKKSKQKNSMRHKLELAVDRRALSPIFATLIILAVVTILFIPVFIWATGTTSDTQGGWQTSGLIATERIVIEEVNLKAGEPCNIYVRNIGKTAVEINDVLIIAPDNSVFSYEKIKGELSTVNPATGDPQKSIVQGELIEIDITNLGSLTLSSNQVYTVKVYTVRGVGEAYQVVA